MITDAFEGLAHALRILPETVYRAHDLMHIDPHEAAGNIEQAETAVLNAFHSVYDSAKDDKRISFDWYGTPEVATLLAIRNARHHNIANRIRGLFTYHLQVAQLGEQRSYIFVSSMAEDTASIMDAPVSWHDIRAMLLMSSTDSKLRSSASTSIFSYLAGDILNSYERKYAVLSEAIFLNITPLVINAVRRVVPTLKPHIKARSVEAETYLDHFESVAPLDTHTHSLRPIALALTKKP